MQIQNVTPIKAQEVKLNVEKKEKPEPKKTVEKEPIQIDKLQKIVDKINTSQTNVQFEITKDDIVLIKIKDKETGKIIRQIPPQELLDMQEEMDNITKGVIFDKIF